MPDSASSSFAAFRINHSDNKHKYHFGVVTNWVVAQALVIKEVLAAHAPALSVQLYLTTSTCC